MAIRNTGYAVGSRHAVSLSNSAPSLCLQQFEPRHKFAIRIVRCCRNLGTSIQRTYQIERPKTAALVILTGLKMASNYKTGPNEDSSSFTFAVRELRQARAAQASLTLAPGPKKVSFKEQGSDPYNSSGSFDRKTNWTRVGKR